ncbi:MAG TPA: hypothetical protein VI197_09640 [Polyangiaceae bacterium]
MRLRRLVTKEAVLLSGVLLTAASCSFIFDTDQIQCEIPDDCAGFIDDATKDVACVEGICEYVYLNPTTASPNTSTTGSAGAGGQPECTENQDCFPTNFGNPAICRDEKCIPLDTDQCPVILGAGPGNENVKSPKEPFIFGVIANLGNPVLEATAAIANIDFAITQVNTKTSGGYRVADAKRPFVAVVCSAAVDAVPAGMEHLVKTLDVPGIISTQLPGPLLEAFEHESYGAHKNNVFMLSTTYADSTLTNSDVDPSALLWHMLGDGVDQAAAYKPLVAQAEAYLRAQRSIPEDENIRIVMVVSDDPYNTDIASVITSTVEFNGRSVVANANDDCGDDIPCFERVNIASATTEAPVPDVSEAFSTILTVEPHLVLAITRSEFLMEDLLPRVETVWDTVNGDRSLPPPMYLFSPRISRNSTAPIVERFDTAPGNNPAFTPLRQRLLGVAPAGAEDTELYDLYLFEFESLYGAAVGEGVTLAGTENYFDAAYFMMYAIHGGSAVTNLTGQNVSTGMTRLLGPGTNYEVFRGDPNLVIKELRSGDEDGYITLEGTMGPPAFRPSGARINLPSIYCFDRDPEDDAMTFYPDVLKYDPTSETLSSPSGEDPCSLEGFLGEP